METPVVLYLPMISLENQNVFCIVLSAEIKLNMLSSKIVYINQHR